MKIAIALLALLTSAPCLAKCLSMHQNVSGVVVDSNAAPVQGAMVRVTWLERDRERSESATTDSIGRFEIHFIFDAYSGSDRLGRDLCEGVLASWTIFVTKDRFQSLSQVVTASDKPVVLKLQLSRSHG